MPTIADIKHDREFYKNFGVLIEALKGIAISQFQALEKKIVSFEDFMRILESFFGLLDVPSIKHPFVETQNKPLGIVAVTSDRGLLGGLNHRVMMAAMSYLKEPKNRLIVVGLQGQKIAQAYKIPCKTFTGIDDDHRYAWAVEIREHIIDEVFKMRIGPVKVIYPFAVSMKIQQIGELNLLPMTAWTNKEGAGGMEGKAAPRTMDMDLLLETDPADLIEYLTTIWIGQKVFDILQMGRLAEFAARTIHLEESSQKIKDIDRKLQLKYFRARHEVIDQQMRELFTSRSLYA